MSDDDETIEAVPVPLPGTASEDDTSEEQVWPQMDDSSPTLSTDSAPSDRDGEHSG